MYFTLTDLVTDIAQNGIESGGSIVELEISENSLEKREFRFTVKDNGKGMSSEELIRVQDPFVTDGVKHPNRKVGLGLPFLIQTANQSGGGWKLESKKKTEAQSPEEAPAGACGTTVSAWFDLGNVDTPPIGDIPGMIRTVLMFSGPSEIVISRRKEAPGGHINYELRKSELVEALGDLEDAMSLVLLDQYLHSMEEASEEEDSDEMSGTPADAGNE